MGTGLRKAMFGQANQRCAISACASGVQMLTPTTAMHTPMKAKRPERRAQRCSAPSVFRIS